MESWQALRGQLDSLLAISSAVASLDALTDVEALALNRGVELTGSAFGFIGLLDDDGERMMVAALEGVAPSAGALIERHGLMSVRSNVFGIALIEDCLVVSNDVEHDPRCAGLVLGHPPVRTFVGVPLRVGAMLLGTLGVANKERAYDRDDERLLSTLANQVSIAVDNTRLYARQRELVRRLVSTLDLAVTGSPVGASSEHHSLGPCGQGRQSRTSTADSDGGLDALTDGQRAILALISEGCSNREIAGRVHLSENTVKTHLQDIFRKLGVHNRVEAAMRAVRGGLL